MWRLGLTRLLLIGLPAGLTLVPEGCDGCFLGSGPLAEQVLSTGLLAVRTPQVVWLVERVPRTYWEVGSAVQVWKSYCPGHDGPGPCWESGSR